MSSRPRANIAAVMPLTNIPIAATIMTVPPAVGDGWIRRRIASAPMAPTASSRNSELASAARIDAFLNP